MSSNSKRLADIFTYLSCHILPQSCSETERRYLKERSENFMIENGELFYAPGLKRIPVDKLHEKIRKVLFSGDERKAVILREHIKDSGVHQCFSTTLLGVSKSFYWPGIHGDVKQLVTSCSFCQANSSCGPTEADTMVEDATPEIPWEKVDICLLGPFSMTRGYSTVVLCLDQFTLWPEAMAVADATPKAVANFLITLIARYGFPARVSSHTHGKEFCQSALSHLQPLMADQCRIVVTPSSIHSDGELTSAYQRVTSSISKLVSDNPTNWDRLLDVSLFPHRICKPAGRTYTPFFLQHNRPIELPVTVTEDDCMEGEDSYSEEGIENMVNRAVKAFTDDPDHRESQPDIWDIKLSSNNKPVNRGPAKEVNLAAVKLYLAEGKFARGYGMATAQAALMNRLKHFLLVRDVLYYHEDEIPAEDAPLKEVPTTKQEVQDVLHRHHNTEGQGDHISEEAMLAELQSKYYWAMLKDDVCAFIEACPVCSPDEEQSEPDVDQEDDIGESGLESDGQQASRRRSVRITKSQRGRMRSMAKALTENEDAVVRKKYKIDKSKSNQSNEDSLTENEKGETDVIDKRPRQSTVTRTGGIQNDGTRSVKKAAKKTSKRVCPECGEAFYGEQIFALHMSKHTGKLPFECDICGKRYRHLKYVEVHKLMHSGIKPFSCTVCQKQFYRKGQLTSHMYAHSDNPRYLCMECGKTFTTGPQLKNHMVVHGDERSFPCDLCEKTFKRASDIYRHKLTHAGEKQFKCNTCPKSFSRPEYLKDHMNHHTNTTPYQCQHCDQKFHDRSGLRYHQKVHKSQSSEDQTISASSMATLTDILGGDPEKVKEMLRTGQAFVVSENDENVEYQIVYSEDIQEEELSAMNMLANVTTEQLEQQAKTDD